MATLKQFVARLRAFFRGGDLDRDFAAGDVRASRDADRGQHPPRHAAGRSQAAGGAAARRRHLPAIAASRRARVPVPRGSRPGPALRVAVDDQGALVVGRGDRRHRARDRRQYRRLHHRQRGVPARLPLRRGRAAACHFVAAGCRLQRARLPCPISKTGARSRDRSPASPRTPSARSTSATTMPRPNRRRAPGSPPTISMSCGSGRCSGAPSSPATNGAAPSRSSSSATRSGSTVSISIRRSSAAPFASTASRRPSSA